MKTSSEKPLILAPSKEPELIDLLAELYSQGNPWTPSGLGTRMHWGPEVLQPSQQVSVRKFQKIINYSKEDLTITVQAGLALEDLQLVLNENNQWLAIDWPWGTFPSKNSNNSGSIGGLIARGLSGSLRHKYMGTRDQIIGIGLIRTDATKSNAGGKVVKNVAGYDLMRLLCGSWGSLALIQELTLRTQPIRPFNMRLIINGEIQDLESFRCLLIRKSYTPEYVDWIKTKSNECTIEIGLSSISKAAIKDQAQGINNLANEYNLSIQELDWEGPLLDPIHRDSFDSEYWLIRLSIPPSKTYELLKLIKIKNILGLEGRISASLGVGDLWIEIFSSDNENNYPELIKYLRDKVMFLGGQLTILNQPKSSILSLKYWLNADSKSIIESIKKQFDPKSQLSIGRLPGVES